MSLKNILEKLLDFIIGSSEPPEPYLPQLIPVSRDKHFIYVDGTTLLPSSISSIQIVYRRPRDPAIDGSAHHYVFARTNSGEILLADYYSLYGWNNEKTREAAEITKKQIVEFWKEQYEPIGANTNENNRI